MSPNDFLQWIIGPVTTVAFSGLLSQSIQLPIMRERDISGSRFDITVSSVKSVTQMVAVSTVSFTATQLLGDSLTFMCSNG